MTDIVNGNPPQSGGPTSGNGGKNAAIGIASAASAAGGFYFGALKDLGMAQLIGTQTAYAAGVFAFVVALILVTGQATLVMSSDARKVVDRMIVFSGAIAAVALAFFFIDTALTKVTLTARYTANIAVPASPTLEPRVLDFAGTLEPLQGDAHTVTVNKNMVEIDIGPLQRALEQAQSAAATADKDYKHATASSQPPPPPPPPL